MWLAGLDGNIVRFKFVEKPLGCGCFCMQFTDIKVPMGVDSKSNTCDEGQEDIPWKKQWCIEQMWSQ